MHTWTFQKKAMKIHDKLVEMMFLSVVAEANWALSVSSFSWKKEVVNMRARDEYILYERLCCMIVLVNKLVDLFRVTMKDFLYLLRRL